MSQDAGAQPMSKCKCNGVKESVLGDGCDICNPEMARDMAYETIEDLKQDLADSQRQHIGAIVLLNILGERSQRQEREIKDLQQRLSFYLQPVEGGYERRAL